MGWLVLNGTETLSTQRAVQAAKRGQPGSHRCCFCIEGSSLSVDLVSVQYMCVCGWYASLRMHKCESAKNFSLVTNVIMYLR